MWSDIHCLENWGKRWWHRIPVSSKWSRNWLLHIRSLLEHFQLLCGVFLSAITTALNWPTFSGVFLRFPGSGPVGQGRGGEGANTQVVQDLNVAAAVHVRLLHTWSDNVKFSHCTGSTWHGTFVPNGRSMGGKLTWRENPLELWLWLYLKVAWQKTYPMGAPTDLATEFASAALADEIERNLMDVRCKAELCRLTEQGKIWE